MESEIEQSELKETQYFWKKPLNQVIITIIFSLMVGHAWHIRGSSVWGGMTGMWAVATLTVFYIIVIFGDRAKANTTWIGLLVLLMAITVGGWGTINSQITGRLTDRATYDITVHPLSGALYMFFVGFGWLPLFAFALSYYFGEKKYKFIQLLGTIIFFYICVHIGKLLIGHIIVKYTATDAYALFQDALTDIGESDPWRYYLSNYFNTSDFELLPGGRNYVSSVDNASKSFAVIMLCLFIRFQLKDKKGANFTFIVSFIIGLSILIADLWIWWGRGGHFTADIPYNLDGPVGLTGTYSLNPPDWFHGWGMWEYFTGFLFGLGLSIYLLKQKATTYYKTATINDTIIPVRFKTFITFLTYYCVVIITTIWFPLNSLFNKWAEVEKYNYLEDFEDLPLFIAGGIYIIVILVMILKNKGKVPKPFFNNIRKHALLLLIIYWTLFFMMDQFLTPRTEEIVNLSWWDIANPKGWRSFENWLDVASFCIGLPMLIIFYILVLKNEIEMDPVEQP